MNRADFGRLIATLRKEHDDERGLPWTQERLAQEANLAAGAELFNQYIIGSLERGKRTPDEQSLLALARALRMTSGERREFFVAACGVDNEEITRRENIPEQVLSQLIDKMNQLHLPALIGDCYYDIVAVNSAVIQLLDLEHAGLGPGSQEDQLYPYNMVRFAFSERGAKHMGQLMGESWRHFAFNLVLFFRTISLQYRCTEYLQGLMQTLRRLRLFRQYWQDALFYEKDHCVDNRLIQLNSPKWGLLSYCYMHLVALTKAGNLTLSVYVPASDHTAEVFADMADCSTVPRVIRIGSWPEKRPQQFVRPSPYNNGISP